MTPLGTHPDPSTGDLPVVPTTGDLAGPTSMAGAVLGDFRVERLLGRGGMGEVYLAHQISLGRPVALKVVRPDSFTDRPGLLRFEAEAATAAQLNHPNIVHIYAVGGQGRARYIAMEYVPGWTLRAYLERKGQPDLRLAFSIMRQATLAVGAAGEVGLVHRDIKPENLLLTRKGVVKVADFGLCRPQGASRPDTTQAGLAVGTPQYMSPEQVQGLPLDHRSDLYSLGVTFYQMLAGVLPFPGQSPLAVALKHVHEQPTDLAVHRPDLSPELIRLVKKLLAKDPADRHSNADALLVDLARARDATLGRGGTDTLGLSTRGEPSASGTFGLSLVLDDPLPILRPVVSHAPGRARSLVPSAAVAIAGGLVLGVVLGWLGRGEDLLSDASAASTGPPGAWMAPNLAAIRHRGTAEAQYRFAQLEAPPADRLAAFLAIPTRFPEQKDHDWVFLAYIQVVRHLVRTDDRDRLAVLAAELARDGPEDERFLAKVAHAGVAAINGQAAEVHATLGPLTSTCRSAPPLATLALEVTRRAMRPEPGKLAPAIDLSGLARSLSEDMQLPAAASLRRLARPG